MIKNPFSPFHCFLFLATITSLGTCNGGVSARCIETEKEALLKLKYDLTDPSNRLTSWSGQEDCCKWYGVICDNFTGHVLELHLRSLSFQEYQASGAAGNYYQDYVKSTMFGGKIDPSLITLKHLRFLDLSNNNFGGISIPKFIGSMTSLRYLNLRSAKFGGKIPHKLGNLSNLQYLSLTGNMFIENLDWISNLSQLEFLDLSTVDLSKALNWLKAINTLHSLIELHLSTCDLRRINPSQLNPNFSSLSVLDLSYNWFDESLVPSWIFCLKNLVSLNLAANHFHGQIPIGFRNMTSLRELDLSSNDFNSSIPTWLCGLSHLQLLDLGSNNLQGKLSSSIGNMTSLVKLDLSFNQLEFEEGIPKSFENLCDLKNLFMSGIKLSQEISEVLEILSGCLSEELESLHLHDCHLSGQLTNLLGQFTKLASLSLSSNLISGFIPMALGELNSLKFLDLSDNKLSGTLPLSFGRLTTLQTADVSHNSLEGEVSEIQFANLNKLKTFYASGNQLAMKVSHNWIPPLELEFLAMRSWFIGPEFPSWLRSLKHLKYLDLSTSGISSTIPLWFWNLSSNFYFLNLSCNQLHGAVPDITKIVSTSPVFDLSSNQFIGKLPYFSSNMSGLDLSNNSFSGSLSNLLCPNMQEVKDLQLLNLGDNLLCGEIPDCWANWKYLQVIKLNNNNFSGNIPWSIGSLIFLESLSLNNNNLSGEIPLSLMNCKKLITLDFGGNNLTGGIPTWMGDRFSRMTILNLRGNKLGGRIPEELCRLNFLHVLDLADNSLSGSIPSCISNFSAMATRNESQGHIYFFGNRSAVSENAWLLMKGKVSEYNSILNFVRSIDLSSNKLSGEIPEEIATLRGLQSLNLSLNLLSGRIPENIGYMASLESMDFSKNQLSGEIPQSLARLTFLSHLNLSCNNLSGRIPSGTQLQSFSPSSFIGNKELCGLPLSDHNCREYGVTPAAEGDDNGLEVDWLYVSITLGFIAGLFSVLGPLLYNRRWRYAYFSFLDRLGLKIWSW